MAGVVDSNDLDAYAETQRAVGPLVANYVRTTVEPAQVAANREVHTFLDAKFPLGHPAGARARRLAAKLDDEMKLAQSYIANAYSGLGSPDTSTASVRRAIQELRGNLAGENYPRPDAAIKALDTLEAALRPSALQTGIFGR